MINSQKILNKRLENKTDIAIIDSGIDPMCGLPVVEYKNFIDDDVSILYEDVTGHGTSVAGIIARKDGLGLNSNVNLYSAKVLDDNDVASVDDVVDAINWAIEKDVDIINMSIGMSSYSSKLKNAIDSATQNGILIVAAAGNKGNVCYPAAFDNVIAVGAVDSQGNVKNSSVGNEVEIVAPGNDVVTTSVYDGTMNASGTSIAAPHVTAIAAYLMSYYGEENPDIIRYVLDKSANKTKNNENKAYGNGILDAAYAVKNFKKLKEEYKNDEKNVVQNMSDVDVVDESVHAKWKQDHHDIIINAGGKELNYVEIKLMRLGSKYADYDPNLKGMTINPYFHGYFEVEAGHKKSNYIASYIFITRLAQKGIYSKDNVGGIQNASGSDNYAKIQTVLNSVLKKNVYGGETNNAENQRYFLWGVAMHSACDLYAHSAYVNGKHLLHADNKADNLSYEPNRFLAAKKICSNVINRYLNSTTKQANGKRVPINGKSGTYSEFVLNDSFYKALSAKKVASFEKDYGVDVKENKAYKLRHLILYMKEVGNTNCNNLTNQSY